MKNLKIAVIGTGYVGLVSGVCFAKIGHEVVCVDNNEDKISKLKNGIVPIYEPGLEEVLGAAMADGKIGFEASLVKGIKEADVIFIAVGTPQDEQSGAADLSFVHQVAKEIARATNQYKVIVTKSTVPVGTGAEIRNIIKEENKGLEFSIVSNPEFLREGVALDDFLNPDRVVIGVEDERAKEIMAQIYLPLSSKSIPIVYSDIVTAELIKYASNSFLATKIAFINEMANLSEKVGSNIKKLSEAIGLDSRIGGKFLNPGPGFGGSCFPKDILALNMIAKKSDVELSLINSVISSNQKRKLQMVDKISASFSGDLEGKVVAILGLAFKSNTDDVRYSPALVIIEELMRRGAIIRTYDKEAMENAKMELGEGEQITYCKDVYEAADGAEAIVIVTEWNEFRDMDLARLKGLLNRSLIIDLRNILDAKEVENEGFEFIYIG